MVQATAIVQVGAKSTIGMSLERKPGNSAQFHPSSHQKNRNAAPSRMSSNGEAAPWKKNGKNPICTASMAIATAIAIRKRNLPGFCSDLFVIIGGAATDWPTGSAITSMTGAGACFFGSLSFTGRPDEFTHRFAHNFPILKNRLSTEKSAFHQPLQTLADIGALLMPVK